MRTATRKTRQDRSARPAPGKGATSVRTVTGAGGERPTRDGASAPFDWPHRIALALVFALLGVLACRQVSSLDVGFHLKAGNHILLGHGWPGNDSFTFTVNDHPYIDTSWGYQIVLALVEKAAGPGGIVLVHAALVLALFALLVRTARLAAVDATSVVAFLLLGGLASEMRFEARPELASYLLLAVVLHLLHRRAAGLRIPLWGLPVIFLIWANTHSLFILGWAALACILAGQWLAGKGFDRELGTWAAASVGICLVNPYGWKGVLFPFTLATRMRAGNVFAQSIGEFVSPFALRLSDQFPFYPKAPIWSFRLYALLCIAAAIALLGRRKLWPLVLWIAFAPLAVAMIRNIPVAIVATLPGVMQALPVGQMFRRRASRSAILLAAGLVAVVIGLRTFNDAYYLADRRTDRFGFGWNRLVLPADAADWVQRAGIHGPVLNHLNFGGWLMWQLPEPVFIDGRLEVMGEDFYKDYLRTMGSAEGLEAATTRYGLRWLIFPYGISPELFTRVNRDARWRLAYADHLACVFTRAEAAVADRPGQSGSTSGAPVIVPPPSGQPFSFSSLPGLGGSPRRTGAAAWASGLTSRQAFPEKDYNLGLFHLFRGELPQAERRFEDALIESGGAYYEVYSNLGAVLWREGRKEEARVCYRIVLEDDPANRIAKERTAF